MTTTALLGLALAVGAPALKDKPSPEPSIVGEWKVESRFDGGAPETDQNLWIFAPGKAGEIRDPIEGSVISRLTYTLLSEGPPKAIDILESQPMGKPGLRQAIYKIEKDTMTLSFTVNNTPRPTSFEPSKGDVVLILTRVNK